MDELKPPAYDVEDERRFGRWTEWIEKRGAEARAARSERPRSPIDLARQHTLIPAERERIVAQSSTSKPLPALPRPQLPPQAGSVRLTPSLSLTPIGNRFIPFELDEPLCAAALPGQSGPVDRFVLIGTRSGLSLLDNLPDDAPLSAPSLEHAQLRHIWTGQVVQCLEIRGEMMVALVDGEIRLWTLPTIRRLVNWRSTTDDTPIELAPRSPHRRLSQLFARTTLAMESTTKEADWARSYAVINLPKGALPILFIKLLDSFIAIVTRSTIYLYRIQEDSDEWTWKLERELSVPDAPTSVALVNVSGETQPRLFVALQDKACAIRLADQVVDEITMPGSKATRPRSTSFATRPRSTSFASLTKGKGIARPSWTTSRLEIPNCDVQLVTYGSMSLVVQSPLSNTTKPELGLHALHASAWRDNSNQVISLYPRDRLVLVAFSETGIETAESIVRSPPSSFITPIVDEDLVPTYQSDAHFLCASALDGVRPTCAYLYLNQRLYMLH